MLLDTEHLHHWMQAIRLSNDPIRTLDAFWRGQIASKEWLIEHLSHYISAMPTIEIHGGWVGVLASLLFQTPELKIQHITSVDFDPTCKPIAEEMNRLEAQQNRFVAETDNMCNRFPKTSVIINTSCEHITQEQYDVWLSHMHDDQLLVLQSNNYNIAEHIRIAENLNDFCSQSNLSKILYQGELLLPKYTRYMLIGYR